MKAVIAAVVLALAMLCSPAHAWNCSNPLAERVLVPTGTTGTFGDGDGQLANFNGQLYECKVVPPSTPQSGGNSSANSTASSNSNSTSNSGSTSSATGGKSSSTSTANGGNATGGNATGGNSSSGVSNSGNSSNTNNNTANGGAGGTATAAGGNQKQTQSSNSSASNNGNGANNSSYSSVTQVAASKIPVASAIAPPSYPTATCFKGFSAAAQSMAFGASFGGGKIDENCARLEAARAAKNRLAFCKVYISDKYVKQAGVSLEDCMAEDEHITVEQGPATVVPEPAPVQPIVVNLPQPVVQIIQQPAPVVVAPAPIAPALKKKSVKRVKPPCYTNDELERLGVPHNKLPQ